LRHCDGRLAGSPTLLANHMAAMLVGLALIALGTFRTGGGNRLCRPQRFRKQGWRERHYLTCYFVGGFLGSVVLGQLSDGVGDCVRHPKLVTL
jgi:YNFM family putative membrane transporter